jgi:hypothetical protein
MDEIVLTHRGRALGASELATIRQLIAAHPSASRRRLSQLVCEAFSWRQANGALRDMVCRSLLLALERAGQLRLPAVRQRPPNNAVLRRPPGVPALDRTPLRAPLAQLGTLTLQAVRRRTPLEALYRGLLAAHHYLGYVRPVGEHLEYLVFAGERPLACLGFGSAPRHLGPRDRFLGWSPAARRRNLRYLAYHTRFLILPWVEVPQLASHLLGRIARRVAADWEARYGHPVYWLETFVDPARFRGTCYRAANWIVLGQTTGRGKDDLTHRPNRPRKQVLGYPLSPRFRERLEAT